MRKLFLKISMLLFVLAMSVNAAWAGVSIGEPSDWYYVNFETRVSTPACGSNPGRVKLNYTDNQGNQDNPWIVGPKTANPYNEETQSTEYGHWNDGFNEGSNAREYGADRDGYPDYYCIDNDRSKGFMDKRGEGWYAGWDWYNAGHYLNTLTGETEDDYQTEWGASANLNGYAMIHMVDMDLDLMSAYAYFEAKVKENYGWYFTGWSYTEGESDLGGAVDTDTPEDKGKLFKIFPSDLQGWSNKSKVYAYATFKPVMVANYKVNGLINKSVSSTTTVVFDVVGERVSAADFTVSCPEDNFSAEITSCVDNKVTVTVTYSGTVDGEFRGNVTLASMSGCSQLTAAVYARVGATSAEEASLYNNKVLVENLVESDDLNTLIGKATATQIVALNNNYSTLNVNRDVTIFTNGYRVSTLNVTNGTVTMAYDKYEGGADAVSVTGGKLILNGGIYGTLTIGTNGEVEQNGANFTGAATNNGTLTTNEGVFNAGLTSSKTLTVNNGTFKGTTALTISGGTANINRGTIEGTTNGLKVTGGTVTIKKLAAIKGGTNSVLAAGGTVDVECGKFDGLLSAVTSFTSGYFKTKADAANVEGGKEWMQLTDGVEYNEGYRFFLGDSETAKTNGVGVCRIGDVSYAKLEDALAYANNKPNEEVVIFMTNNYTLPAGYYTLPAKATLVVPMSDSQQKINLTAPRLVSNDVQDADEDKYINNIPYEFRRLTFATGVNMDVIGKIEMTCTQYSSNEAYTSQPVGAYGHLVLEEGSHLTLQSGSEVRAWGFVTGKGEMDARRGSTVREMFQMGDWKGAMTSVAITGMVGGTDLENVVKSVLESESGDFSDKKIFPVSQYFIQNIESPVKYHPGALLSTSAAVSEGVYGMSLSMSAPDIAVVGVSGEHTAIFLMDIAADAENTWVRKWYDAENDVQVYDINSGAHIGSMELDLGGVSLGGATIPVRLNSAMFDLPITSNFKIHLLSGSMDFEQNTSLLPGSEVEVDKESTVSISMSTEDKQAKELGTPGHVYHTGAVYVYDAAQWDTYAYDPSGAVYTKVVRYVPSVGGQPTKRTESSKPASAKINVHGTFNTADGFVYTTASGANIFSNNEDAGTFIFNNAGEDAGEREVWQIKGKGTKNSHYTATTFTCAQLKNKDNSYTATEDAIAGFAFLYRDDKWQEPMTQTLSGDIIATYNSNCFAADVSMMTYLSQICDIDPLNPTASPMSDAAKTQIAIVHAPDNIAEYLVAKYIAANQASMDLDAQTYEWAKAHLNDDHSGDTPQNQYMFQLFGQLFPYVEPQKVALQSAGYDLGSAVQKVYIKPQEWVDIVGTTHLQLDVDAFEFGESYDAALEAASQSDNYSACDAIVEEYLDYVESQRFNPYIVGVDGNTDHTYSDAAGAGRLFILMDNCQWWEVEKKDNLYHCIHPQNDTYYYWDENEEMWMEKKFTITWKNWNGDIIQTANADGNPVDYYEVTYGTQAEFLGTNPTRSSNIDYTYDFTGWSPALGKVTSDVTYTATFTEKPRKYTIIFCQEGGVEIERHFLTHNEVPVCENVPTKVGHTLEWSPAIAAVTGDATYTATWLENPPTEYEVTFFDYDGTTPLQQSNVAVGAMPEYTGSTPTGKATWAEEQDNKEFTYVFDHWSPALEEVSATSIKSYTAVYAEVAKTYTIIFQDEDGEEIEHHQYQYGETPVCSDVPKKAADAQYTYTLRWTPQIQTVMEAATYRAVFDETLNKYTVSVMSNPSGACAISGAGIYDYNTSATAVTITITPNPGYTFAGWSDDPENTNTTRQMAITGDVNLVANFTVAEPDYTITWKNEAGTANLVDPVGQKAGTATIYTGAIPTKPATAQYSFTFDGWTTSPNGEGTFYKNNMTPKATASVSYYAHFAAAEVIMEVGLGQAQNIAEETTVNQLILNSNGTVSGQMTGNINNLNVTGVCYYDLTGTFTAGKWYAVAVPWQVKASDIRANGNALSWMSGDYLAYYDGSVRAAQGKVDACWKYVKNSDVLIPGRLYMLYLENGASVLRFPKKAGAPILTSTTSVSAYSAAEAANANWNGISNPAIYYAYISNTGATVGQVFNADAQSYEAVALSNKLIVAKPIFVQATNSGSATAVTTPPASPVRRRTIAETQNAEYQVEIASYGRMQDRLFINANEDKETDTYTIGQDVLKFGVSDKVAQMWVNRYDAKLCMNTMAPVNSVTEFPLSIFAPKSGEYTIAIEKEKASEDHTLYLTYNGEAIWNLSEGAYVANLNKGTDANYGLRISVKNAPQTTTGIDEAIVDAQGETKKVLIDNKVFIIRGEKVYTIDGQLVK